MQVNSDLTDRYKLSVENGRVVLTAKTFRAEKGSVLHSGIFSRELASSFVGAALTLLFLMVVFFTVGISLLYYGIAALLFALATLFSRIFLFKEPFLETVIDKDRITITLNRPILKKVINKSISQLRDIRIDYWRFEPENPDGVEFVKKIALQHGTVMPDFGKTKEFYNLVMDFGEESFVILTSEKKDDIDTVLAKLKDFLFKKDESPSGKPQGLNSKH